MEIKIQKIWASPSTLHFQCVVTGKDRKWMRFVPCSVALAEIPDEVRRMVMESDNLKHATDDGDVPLWS